MRKSSSNSKIGQITHAVVKLSSCLEGGSCVRRINNLISLILCVLLLSSCNTTKQEESVILLRQKDSTPGITPVIRVERVAVQSKVSDQKTVYKTPNIIPAGTLSWVAKEIDAGSPAMEVKYYDVTYDYFGNELSRTYVYGADEKIASSSRIRQYGSKLEVGSYFRPEFSRYGLDCVGCGGQYDGTANTAIGVNLHKELGVKQASGSWESGITWEGYYIVAADKSIPFCTILEISNHNFSGAGLTPGKSFQAIVLDRGGAIKNNKLDLYIGSEENLNNVRYLSRKQPLAKVIKLGQQIRKNGKLSCKV